MTSKHTPPRTRERTWDEIVLDALEGLAGDPVPLSLIYQAVCEEDPESASWAISRMDAEAEIRWALHRLRKAGKAERVGRGIWRVASG